MKLIEDDKYGSEEATSDEDREDFSCSNYVNQFPFRFIDNRTATAGFFFDNGSASGDQIAKQIKQVTLVFFNNSC